MLRFLTLSAVLGFAAASGYGGGYGGGGGGGGGYGSFYGHGGGGYGHSVHAAVISHHNVKHYDVPSSGYTHPVSIDVPANVLPVNFIFRSSSSHINVASKHEGAAGSFKETHSQDEPHVLRHTVTKPIIQEVREIITPSRSIVQTIQPVREQNIHCCSPKRWWRWFWWWSWWWCWRWLWRKIRRRCWRWWWFLVVVLAAVMEADPVEVPHMVAEDTEREDTKWWDALISSDSISLSIFIIYYHSLTNFYVFACNILPCSPCSSPMLTQHCFKKPSPFPFFPFPSFPCLIFFGFYLKSQ